MNRDYVIVCNEHNSMWNGCLLFWGHHTKDNENRSFGGYTSDIEKCERYTLEEIRDKNYHFPVYDKRMSTFSFRKHDDVIIKLSQLEKLGYAKMTVMYNP